jgi:hypothetical protein
MTTLERILDAMEVIATEADYVFEAIQRIDNSVPQKSESIANVVSAREKTNQRLISFYENLLDSLDWEDFDEDENVFDED